MAASLRCTGIVLETWPILPIALKFAHSNISILKQFEDNYTHFRILLDCVPRHPGALRITCEVFSEHRGAHRVASSLPGSIWEHMEGSVWLFRVAELFSYDFPTILHFADESRPPSASPNLLDYVLKVHLWVHWIIASKYISKLARLWPWNAPVSSLNLRLQVHLHTRTMMTSTYISQFTTSRCGETAELSCHPTRIAENVWIRLG